MSSASPPESATTIAATAEAVRSARRSAAEVVRESLDRIERLNPDINAVTQVFADRALEQARAMDVRVAAGEGSNLPLAGVPLLVKDNICLDHGLTTCASRMLETYQSPFTATALKRLLDAGAIVVGKSNLDEFAMGSSTESSVHGPTRNPWDRRRVPGGSSGGSAAAVAAGMTPGGGALGSDTGGSIRQPAGWCNVVGFKPTYGRVSRYGLVAYASSLDQIGTLTRTVEDAAVLTEVMSGHDPRDSTTIDAPAPALRVQIERPVEGLTIGVPREARSAANHSDVGAALDRAIRTLEGLGAKFVEVGLPHAEYGIAAYYLIATAEASSNLARFDGVRYGRRAALGPGDDLLALYERSRSEGFGAEVQRRIMLGTHALSSGYYDAYYNTALKARRLIKQDFDHVFEGTGGVAAGCHAVLMPSSPGPAFRLGERSTDPIAMYLEDVYTVGVNLAGLPGVTVPGGFAKIDDAEMPVGLQFIGPALGEATLLRIARMFEQATGFGRREAPMAGSAR